MAKTTTQASTNVVIQNITIKSNSRKTQDIENWKKAIKSFENILNPNRVLIYELYEDILLDGQIESTWGKRQDMVLNKDLTYVKDGKEDEEINKLINSPDMRRLIKELHNSIAFGYTLVQINNIAFNEEENKYEINFDLIPRKHVHPERGFECISKEQSSATKDIFYKEPPLSRYMLTAGDAVDMGIFIKAAQYVIYKRGDFGDWAQFAEMFGMPFREARYDDYDDRTRIALENAMEAYGGAPYAILPKSAEFKMHDAVKGTAGDLYKTLYDACNAEISKIILGNTLTTEQGNNGARSLGEVHQGAEDNKNLSDEKMILDILNSKFKSILKIFGFAVDGEIWYKSEGKDWKELKDKWDVVSGIKQTVPVSDDFIYEEFDIPKPENYDELKTKLEEQSLNTIEKAIQDPLKQNAATNNLLINRIKDFFV